MNRNKKKNFKTQSKSVILQKIEEIRSISAPNKQPKNDNNINFNCLEYYFRFENINLNNRENLDNSEYNISINEENLLNKDILNELNSPKLPKVCH